jgi:single-stranded DNA-binding protein
MLPAHPVITTMSAANSGTIVGTIVSDITQRTPSDSLKITEFRISPVDNQEKDSPIPVTVYNGAGDKIAARYNKGDTIALEYRLRYNTWMSPEGEPRGRMEVIAVSTSTVRLGQISTAQRIEAAAAGEGTVDLEPEAVQTVLSVAQPTLEAIPF